MGKIGSFSASNIYNTRVAQFRSKMGSKAKGTKNDSDSKQRHFEQFLHCCSSIGRVLPG